MNSMHNRRGVYLWILLYQVKQRAGDQASLQKIWRSHSIPISTKMQLMKVPAWPVATYGCESWTLRRMKKFVLTPLR